MGMMVERSAEARRHRKPDLFLSHSSRDKKFVRQLADDLVLCQVDVWLDEWEIQIGDSLHDVIGNALEKSRFIGVVLGDHSSDSIWARDELKQALSKEKRLGSTVVFPIVCGNGPIPAFIEDKVYLDFRSNYYAALARLAAAIHNISRLRIEERLRGNPPSSIRDVINALRYVGFEPYLVLGEDDFKEIASAVGADVVGDRIRFDPEDVATSLHVSQRIRDLMNKLMSDDPPSPHVSQRSRDLLEKVIDELTAANHPVSSQQRIFKLGSRKRDPRDQE